MTGLRRFDAVLFDVDGTLIDSNSAHAEAWAQALCENRVTVRVGQVRPLIGMGGDKLLPAIAGIAEDSQLGRRISQRKKALFEQALPSLSATRGARALLELLRDHHVDLIIATSADDRELAALLKQAGVDDLFPKRTSKDDAAESKPDPDIVQAAISKSRANKDRTVMIGDTPYDIEAATRAGLESIAFRCGGFWSDADLAGAVAIFDDPEAFRAEWITLSA